VTCSVSADFMQPSIRRRTEGDAVHLSSPPLLRPRLTHQITTYSAHTVLASQLQAKETTKGWCSHGPFWRPWPLPPSLAMRRQLGRAVAASTLLTAPPSVHFSRAPEVLFAPVRWSLATVPSTAYGSPPLNLNLNPPVPFICDVRFATLLSSPTPGGAFLGPPTQLTNSATRIVQIL